MKRKTLLSIDGKTFFSSSKSLQNEAERKFDVKTKLKKFALSILRKILLKEEWKKFFRKPTVVLVREKSWVSPYVRLCRWDDCETSMIRKTSWGMCRKNSVHKPHGFLLSSSELRRVSQLFLKVFWWWCDDNINHVFALSPDITKNGSSHGDCHASHV